MKKALLSLIFAFLPAGAIAADGVGEVGATVIPLIAKDLPDLQGKETVMIMVEYPPGSADPIHRHNADAFVYVLEGSIVMQVRGAPEVTLSPGQTFYEGPNDVHIVGRNASKTDPAKFIVFLVKEKGAPILSLAE